MRNLLLAAAALGAALLVSACGGNSYTIEGVVEDPSLEGAKVYKVASFNISDLVADPTQSMPMDSTLVQEGKYTFSGKVSDPDYCTIYVGDLTGGNLAGHATVVIEPGAKISVVTDADHKTRVSGTPANDMVQQNAEQEERLGDQIMAIYDRLAPGRLMPKNPPVWKSRRMKSVHRSRRPIISSSRKTSTIRPPGSSCITSV